MANATKLLLHRLGNVLEIDYCMSSKDLQTTVFDLNIGGSQKAIPSTRACKHQQLIVFLFVFSFMLSFEI